MSFHRPYSPSPSDPPSENHHTILYPTASSSCRPSLVSQEVTGYETIFDELPRYEAIQPPLLHTPRAVSPPPYSEIAPYPDINGGDEPGSYWYMTDAGLLVVSPSGRVRRFDRAVVPSRDRSAPSELAHRLHSGQMASRPFRAGLGAPRPREESDVLRAREALLESLRIMEEDDEVWDRYDWDHYYRDRYGDDSEVWDSEGDYEYDSEEDGGSDGGLFRSDVGQRGSADGSDDSEEGPSRRELRM